MGGMGIFWILLVVVLALVLWKALCRPDAGSHRQESPEEILKRRYAGGEIEHEEYARRLQDLRR